MKTAAVILGNQLFPISKIKLLKTDLIFMAEDYGLCTHFKYHKHKIILFLSAMRDYRDEISSKNYQVCYYDAKHNLFKKSFESKLSDFLAQNEEVTKINMFEIEDKFFEKKIITFFKKKKIELEFIKSPMFLTSREDFRDYLSKSKKPFMKTFYEKQRKSFKILIEEDGKPSGGKWSFDQQNRKKIPKDLEPPEVLASNPNQNCLEVMNFVDQNFSDHIGEVNDFWLPTTRKESLRWLNRFISDRLKLFGDFQDSISKDSKFVFHSVLSPMINMGLILPQEVLEKITTAYLKNTDEIPLNSVEGFARQVLGWREFVRGIYQNFSEKQDSENFWGNTNQLNDCWYSGDTKIPILDDAIKKAKDYSYGHHIERLMVISNFMLLCEIEPKEVYKWFMEMYSDSSDWVMGPNVFGMGQFSDGGLFATKPYICGSNYYLKMSRYDKGEWCDIADGLFWRFIDKHKDFYAKNPRMNMMVKTLEKMDPERQNKIFGQAEKFIKKVTAKELS